MRDREQAAHQPAGARDTDSSSPRGSRRVPSESDAVLRAGRGALPTPVRGRRDRHLLPRHHRRTAHFVQLSAVRGTLHRGACRGARALQQMDPELAPSGGIKRRMSYPGANRPGDRGLSDPPSPRGHAHERLPRCDRNPGSGCSLDRQSPRRVAPRSIRQRRER